MNVRNVKIEVGKSDLQYCIFAITKKCNLRCKWCYENSTPGAKKTSLSTKEILLIIKKLKGLESIGISGGEASLHPDIIKILDETRKNCKSARLLSNGIFINDKLLQYLRNSKIKVSVSLDGTEKNHDRVRGKGTYKKVLENIEKMKNLGIDVSIQCTLSKNNLKDVDKIIHIADKLKINSVSFLRMKPLGRGSNLGKETLSSGQIRRTIKKIKKLKNFVDTNIIFKDPLDNTFDIDLKKFASKEGCVAGGCRVGIESIYIENNGDIFPCPFLRIKIGNALKDNPFDIFIKSNILSRIRNQANYDKCKECDNWLVCRGCRAEAFIREKNYLGNDIGCWR